MEPRMNSGRPARPQQARQTPAAAPAAIQTAQYKPEPKKRNKWVLAVGVAVALVLLGLVVWKYMSTATASPRGDRYQAVFLDNGQVFFGKLKNTEGTYLLLSDAYYTKSQELPKDATDEQKAAVSNNVNLVKVGNEVYGPENSLSIKAEQVLFWQDLKSDSKVAKAIADDQNE
jgi:hypothetical protein